VSPPTTETELQLAAAFAAVFKLDGPTAIDLDAHFFQLGGDSLLCLRLVQV
jgi:acyl carrier protein